jgi:hypothetical protein
VESKDKLKLKRLYTPRAKSTRKLKVLFRSSSSLTKTHLLIGTCSDVSGYGMPSINNYIGVIFYYRRLKEEMKNLCSSLGNIINKNKRMAIIKLE